MDEDFFYFIILLGKINANLTGQEIKYLILRFVYKKNDMEIAKFEDRKISRAGINIVIQRAYRKIKLNPENRDILLKEI